MFSSEAAASADMNKNSNFFLSNPVNYFQAEQSHHHNNQHQSTGLARYRSAPSSFLAALLDNDNSSSNSGDEAEALMFSDFFSGSHNTTTVTDLNHENRSTTSDAGKNPNHQHRVNGGMKQEIVENHHQMGCYESAVNGGGGAVVGSYSLGMETDVHLRMHSTNNIHTNTNSNSSSNLVRQTSSPAGFLNGFSVMGDVGSYRLQNRAETNSSANHLSNHINFSRTSYMPSIPENGNETAINSASNNNNREFSSAFAQDSWNGLKRNRDGDLKMVSNNGENGKRSTGLVHHSSLPKTASEMATAEKFLHFQQDSIQIRAKRGCATHPRSIAERMRRTRISEKMKKLQDLFPNLDKQTNTADMLDMAVESIKELQKQVQLLKERKAKCVCPNKSRET